LTTALFWRRILSITHEGFEAITTAVRKNYLLGYTPSISLNIAQIPKDKSPPSSTTATCYMLLSFLAYSATLNMETTRLSEIFMDFSRPT
jgi:hypothetical protein